jgi:hypothetical protein
MAVGERKVRNKLSSGEREVKFNCLKKFKITVKGTIQRDSVHLAAAFLAAAGRARRGAAAFLAAAGRRAAAFLAAAGRRAAAFLAAAGRARRGAAAAALATLLATHK